MQLTQYLIKNGNKRILKDLKESLFLIRMLEEFNCIDQGTDRGAPIKELAKKTCKLIQANVHLLKDKKYEKEINFKTKPAPKSANAMKKKPAYATRGKKAAGSTRTKTTKKKDSDGQFGAGFLELDFEEDTQAIEQEKFYKDLA